MSSRVSSRLRPLATTQGSALTGPTSRSASSSLLRLSVPLIGFNSLSVLSLTVDTMMCGSLPNASLSLTALGFATQLIYLLMTAMMGLSIGAVTLISRAYGAGDTARVTQLFRQAIALTLGVSLGITVVGNIASPFLLGLLGAREAVLAEALRYVRPLLTGAVLHYLVILFGSTMRGVGNTWWPFCVGLIANLLNVLFNYSLILGNFGFPQWGVAGAAYGTLLSHACSVLALGFLLVRGAVPALRLSFRPVRFDPKELRSFLRIGAPAMLDYIVLNLAYLSVIGLLGHVSELAVAAHGIGMRLQLLAFIPALSISQATAALVGQHLGAHAPERAKATVKAALVQSLTLMVLLPLIILVCATPLLTTFGVQANTPLASPTLMWMTIMGLSMPILGTNIVFVGMMQGAGITLTSLKINAFATLLLQVPFGWIVGHLLGVGPMGIWLSIPVGFGVRAALGAWVFYRGTWAQAHNSR